jgi:hypothetical protein
VAAVTAVLLLSTLNQAVAIQFAGHGLVDVAPDPRLSRFDGTNKRVLAVMEVLGCVLVFRRVATSYFPALKTQPQMDPGVAGFYAVFTNMFVSAGEIDLLHM